MKPSFGVLGPLRIRTEHHDIPITAQRERTILATLLLHANHTVSIDTLVHTLWDNQPPTTARTQVQGCVLRLRRQLTSAGLTDGTVTTTANGYLLQATTDRLDTLQFQDLITQARQAAATDPDRAARTLRRALALWRGPALADVDSALVQQAAAQWEEKRSQAWEDCLDLELTLGKATDLIGELTTLIHQHPHRERPRAQLMLALYRSARQGDALTLYRQTRQQLAHDLGVEPSTELQQLHQRILRRDPALTPPIPRQRSRDSTRRYLPRSVGDFTGRDTVIAELLAAVPDEPGAASVVQAIDGMPGVGKTSLAVHVAHLIADRYPDAQLAIDLQGHSTDAPLDPAVALDLLLRQMDVAPERIPDGLAARVALWRSQLAGRRILLLLDNAATSNQIEALLPNGPGCLTVITSRRRLTGLDGAPCLALDVLTTDEAVALLHRIVGERIQVDPDAAADIACHCGHLALAIRLAGTRLVHRPGWSAQDVADLLAEAGRGLRDMTAEGRSVAAAFALSYNHLGEPAQQLFRLLGLPDGPDIDVPAAASLADTDLPETRTLLADLVDAHLLDEPAPGRYRMHDLLREYARDHAETGLPPAERLAATTRLLDFYLHSCAALSSPLETHPFAYELGPPPRHARTYTDPTSALAWFTAERANLVAAVQQADRLNLCRYTWLLTRALWRFTYLLGHADDLLTTHEIALHCALRNGDDYGAAITRQYLASGYYRQGRCRQALATLLDALDYLQRTDNRGPQSQVLYLIGVMMERLCRYPEALDYLHRSIALRESGDEAGTAMCYMAVGIVHFRLGHYEQALDDHDRALAIGERSRPWVEGPVLGSIGAVQLRLGRLDDAEKNLRAAIESRRLRDSDIGTADMRNELGKVLQCRGDLRGALRYHREALDLVRGGVDELDECTIRNALGTTLRLAGDNAGAVEQHQRALALAVTIEYPLEQGRALAGLAEAESADDPATAQLHWRQALTIFTNLGVAEQHDVADKLRAPQRQPADPA
jgi:DNA-binding SARP family transcriptional activator/tetratricopeptide (TPR) repeat protein